jgi:protein ImuA
VAQRLVDTFHPLAFYKNKRRTMAGVDGRQARLEALRRQIAKAQSFSPRSDEQVPLGIPKADACLNGGVARGALHEIAAADHRSLPAALGFLLALTRQTFPSPERGGSDRLERSEKRSGEGSSPDPHPIRLRNCSAGSTSPFQGEANVLWPFSKTAHPFGTPYAPGLRFFGLDPARILFVRCTSARDCLWTMEEGLRLGGVRTVISARPKAMDLTASRRLQLAAEQAATPVFLLRNYNDGGLSAAVTRWRIAPAPSARDEFGFTENARFHVALEYARGGKPGEWVMEWNSDTLRLHLSSALGDRAAGEGRAA